MPLHGARRLAAPARQAALAAALAVLAAALTVLAAACTSARPAHPPRRAGARATPTPTSTSTSTDRPTPPVHPVLEGRSRISSGVVALAAGDGSLWVSGFGSVTRIDPATGGAIARIAAPRASYLTQMASGAGSIWATADYGASVVYRIDPLSNRVAATIPRREPVLGITVAAGRVWVSLTREGPGQVIAIDPRTDRVTQPPITVGPGPGELAYGDATLWVQNTSPASLMRIDPPTGRVSTILGPAPVNYGSPPVGAIAFGYGSLWATVNGSLTRFDPRTGHALANEPIPGASEVAIGAGEVWVLAEPGAEDDGGTGHTAALWEIDPLSDRPVAKPLNLRAAEPIALTATDKYLWVGDYGTKTVMQFRLIPDTSPHRH